MICDKIKKLAEFIVRLNVTFDLTYINKFISSINSDKFM